MRAARADDDADDDDEDDDKDRFKRPGEERARLRAGDRAERADCETSNSRRLVPDDWTWTTGRTALGGDGVSGAPGGERAAAASSGGGGDADAPADTPARRDGATMSSSMPSPGK